ncbi:hypothetical protein IAR55_003736 [Kwoniella newhampshirensis]|uniref:Peptide hydrolase n=1 Tax=Kwoniella newhampshirensis TaxID=1651941 RepID=A0AAW0Z119_9TREE
MRPSTSLAFLLTAGLAIATPLEAVKRDQLVFSSSLKSKVDTQASDPPATTYQVHPSILAALGDHPDDPVSALTAIDPAYEAVLRERRLLEVAGQPAKWMTEGDKLELRRAGLKFLDLTDRQDAMRQFQATNFAGHANLPNITQQKFVIPSLKDVSIDNLNHTLTHLTSYFNRYYHSNTGEQSSRWLHDHIAGIIAASPFRTYISLEYVTHTFDQSSIIARFEPHVRNASLPYTVIGAHQDSANYYFPLLPAPGADDDGSGTVAILEAFRVLATRGFIPANGPVEFVWFAAEEAGNLGSLPVAGYKKDIGAKIGAMLEFDGVGFIAKNATESIALVISNADAPLTNWIANLSSTYIDLPVKIRELDPRASSDYESFTRLGFPAAFATEGDPEAMGGFPGEYNRYYHTVDDRIDVDDETGHFSFEHMAHFSELAIAFAIEQAGWSLKHTREADGTGATALWNSPVSE